MSKKFPYSRVYVEITNLCNRNCAFCPGTVRDPRMMTVSEFRSVAQKLTGVTGYLYYHLMGEPLTHPGLPEMIGIARSLGFKSQITTNGTLLRDRGQALIDAGVHKVNISVHSFEEGSNEDYVNYINACLDFADRASRGGIIVVLRLWNNGYDEGRNISPWIWRRQGSPGTGARNPEESASKTSSLSSMVTALTGRTSRPMTAESRSSATVCGTISASSATVPWSPAAWIGREPSAWATSSGRM